MVGQVKIGGDINMSRKRIDTVLDTLQGLVKDGEIKPRDVVAEAKDEASPLHKYFEWDDKVAGDGYRLTQARDLITYKFRMDENISEHKFFNVRVVVNKVATQGYF